MGYGDRTLVGIGGWLAFFVIVLAVFTPLATMMNIAQLSQAESAAVFGDKLSSVMAFEIVLGLINVLGAWFLVWRLVKVESWQTVRIVIAGIWILGVGLALIELLLLVLVGGIGADIVVYGGALAVIRPAIFATIWTTYFLRSERVANTYLRDADPEELDQVFG
ncbi:MAG TPA: DUF2569 family protein [Allosphingosinicella sp.]